MFNLGFSEGDKMMNEVKGMTVFNTEPTNPKKQPMFFGKPLGFNVMIHTNIQYLRNSPPNNLDTSGDLRRSHYRKIGRLPADL